MCWCFPEESKFKTQYMETMKDKYLAKKTLKTVTSWLAGSNSKDFTMVAFYAESDFSEHVGEKLPHVLKQMAIDNIHNTLSTIAEPCECDK